MKIVVMLAVVGLLAACEDPFGGNGQTDNEAAAAVEDDGNTRTNTNEQDQDQSRAGNS